MLLPRGNRRSCFLTLVAIGALLGVEIFRRHGKHLVALDADAVDNALGALRGRAVRVVRRLRGLVLFRHGPILAQAGLRASAGPLRQTCEHTRDDVADAERTLQPLGSGKVGRRRRARIDYQNRHHPREIAERFAREIGPRTGLDCRVVLAHQTEFPEPLVRINTDRTELPGWSESAAWDAIGDYYSREGRL